MQGIGMSYQTEFDNFMDLFGRKKKKAAKRNFLYEAIQDSTRNELKIEELKDTKESEEIEESEDTKELDTTDESEKKE